MEENKTEAVLKITSIEDLKKYKGGTIVELPPFAEGQPFVARIKRPSIMRMVKNGKIPNTLLTKANTLFLKGNDMLDIEDEKLLSQMMEIMDTIVSDMFVEPTYKQLLDNEIELTDEQIQFMYNYSQRGVAMLENFRTV